MLSACLLTKNAVYLLHYVSWPLSVDTSCIWPQMRPWSSYIYSEGLSNVNQSAYRRLHSTESALLKIQNDIAALMDSGNAVPLTLLDLSAAFDTIDHDILFNSLRDWFGVDGTVLRWIKSYLSNRKQKVKLGNSFSDAFSLRALSWAPFFLPSILPLSVISFPISMSPTIYMLMTPKYI